jgi:hypothetical protein
LKMMRKRTEWLLHLFSCRNKAEIDKGCHRYSGNSVPAELTNELEGKEEQIEPNGAAIMIRIVLSGEIRTLTVCWGMKRVIQVSLRGATENSMHLA